MHAAKIVEIKKYLAMLQGTAEHGIYHKNQTIFCKRA
jgi:hypothetical protein